MIRKKHITLCFSLFLALSMVLGQLIPIAATDTNTEVATTEEQMNEPETTAEEVPEPEEAGDETDPVEEEVFEEEITESETEEPGEIPPATDEETVIEEDSAAAFHEEVSVDGYKVVAYAAEGVLPEGARLKVQKLDPESPEYKKAGETLDSQKIEYSGFAALDIHFELDGAEIEPDQEAGSVQIEMEVDKSLLPEDDAEEVLETLAVQHHDESDGKIEAVPVAAASDGKVQDAGQTIKAGFSVDSFSTFTITWKSWRTTYATITAHLVDDKGNEIVSSTPTKNVSGLQSTDALAPDISGYSFSEAYLYGDDGQQIKFTEISATYSGRNYGVTFFNGSDKVLTVSDTKTISKDVYLKYEKGVYNLYTYTLLPNKKLEDYKPGEAGSANECWNGMGMYKISAPKSAQEEYSSNGDKDITIPYSDVIANEEYDLKTYAPDDEHRDYRDHNNSTYPDITVDGVSYHYDPTGTQEKSYQIEWFRLVTSNGSNDGNNGYNPNSSGRTYHLDGYIRLREEAKLTVDFKVQLPDSSVFQAVGLGNGAEPFVTRIDKGTNESAVTKPTEDNSTWREKIVQNGVSYVFDGWYRDEAMTERCSWDQVLNDNQTYYGAYKPETVTLKVTNTVTGNMGNYTDPFHYTLQLLNADGTAADYQIDGLEFDQETKTHSFALAHGKETAEFAVPMDLTYRITQTDGYDHKTSATNNRGGGQYGGDYADEGDQTHTHDLKENTIVNFINEKTATIPSGLNDHDSAIHGLIISVGAGLLLVGAIIALRRRINAI